MLHVLIFFFLLNYILYTFFPPSSQCSNNLFDIYLFCPKNLHVRRQFVEIYSFSTEAGFSRSPRLHRQEVKVTVKQDKLKIQ